MTNEHFAIYLLAIWDNQSLLLMGKNSWFVEALYKIHDI